MTDKDAMEKAAREYISIPLSGSDRCLPLDDICGLAFESGWQAALSGPKVMALKKALSDWYEWEQEQIKKVGPYEGKRINELIKGAQLALAEFEGEE